MKYASPSETPKNFEPFNFRFKGNFDVSKISNYLMSNDIVWGRERIGIHHAEANPYYINNVSEDWNIGEPYVSTYVSKDDNLWFLIEPIISHFEKEIGGKMGKVLFIRLPEGKEVYGHYDYGDYLSSVRRHHLAIETNPDVQFSVGGETINIKPGECWEINNVKWHGVKNSGDSMRIHLLFDIMPSKYVGSNNA
jgi:hypothetical protein